MNDVNLSLRDEDYNFVIGSHQQSLMSLKSHMKSKFVPKLCDFRKMLENLTKWTLKMNSKD